MIKRKQIKIKRKRRKDKVWTLKKADEQFSLFIRKRDGRCLHPVGCPKSDIKDLQCSHFIGRAHKATRYDPKNCIALCWFHHYKSKEYGLEYHKQTKGKHGFDGWYTAFMKTHIGEAEFVYLMERSRQSMMQKKAILQCQSLLGGV